MLLGGILKPEAQSLLPLWPNHEPGLHDLDSLGSKPSDDQAALIAFPVESRGPGIAIIICPGGAYGILALAKEGLEVAHWLNSLGISAFVLRYHLGPKYRFPIQLEEGKRAIRWVRSHANQYHIDPNKIGMMGFSAGAHLTTMLTSKAASKVADEVADVMAHGAVKKKHPKDATDAIFSRPDFQILIYPVISMAADYSHHASRTNLLGHNPSPTLLNALSAEKNISSKTPPTFLVHAKTDPVVLFQNSEVYFQACQRANVPVEFLVLEKGGHAFGLGTMPGNTPEISVWPDSCARWLKKTLAIAKKPK